MGKYDDIINLPHHVSDYRKPMPMANRAAQFAPFAALSGHDDAMTETARITDLFKELSEVEKNMLSRKLNLAIKNHLLVAITYFVPDKIKTGGSYQKITQRIKKWEEYDNTLLLENSLKISVDLISDIVIKNSNIEF